MTQEYVTRAATDLQHNVRYIHSHIIICTYISSGNSTRWGLLMLAPNSQRAKVQTTKGALDVQVVQCPVIEYWCVCIRCVCMCVCVCVCVCVRMKHFLSPILLPPFSSSPFTLLPKFAILSLNLSLPPSLSSPFG